MTLKDLFRPKWQHSDPEKRRQAVERGLDEKTLAIMAGTDPDFSIRILAVEKMYSLSMIEALMNDADYQLKKALRKRARVLKEIDLRAARGKHSGAGEMATAGERPETGNGTGAAREVEKPETSRPVLEVVGKSGKARIKAIQAVSDVPVLMELSSMDLDREAREYMHAQMVVYAEDMKPSPYRAQTDDRLHYLTAAYAELQDPDAIAYALSHEDHSFQEEDTLLLNKMKDVDALKTLVEKTSWTLQERALERLAAVMMPSELIRYAEQVESDAYLSRALFALAARLGIKDVVAHHLDKGVEIHEEVVNAAMNHGKGNGQPEILRMLLRAGFPVNQLVMNDRYTLLLRAIEDIEDKPVVRVLLEEGADAGIIAHTSPLLEAVRNGDSETVSLLLEHGADKTINNNDHALGIVKLDPNSTGTALHAACAMDRKDLVKILLEHDADPRALGHIRADGFGPQPRHLTDDEEILSLLAAHETREANS